MTLPIPHLGPLGLGLAAAIVSDLRRRRIPNAICGFVFFCGLTIRVIDQGWLQALMGVGAAALVVAALYRPWLAQTIGGGDVKLAAASALWIPFSRLHWFALGAALVGGLVALINYFLARRPVQDEIRANLTLMVLRGDLPVVPSHRSRQDHRGVPYAVAIAGGVFVAFFVGL